jgi:hypothetical protein
VTVSEIENYLNLKYGTVLVSSYNPQFFQFHFSHDDNRRTLSVSYYGNCLQEHGIDGIWCSLGCFGNSVDIMTGLCETFGGYLDENDCDDEGFYPINFELFKQGKDYNEMDLLINKIISQLGYNNLKKTLTLFDEFKKLN